MMLPGPLPSKFKAGAPIGRVASLAALEQALRRLAATAERGHYVLLTEAEQLFAALTGARSARIVVHSGGAWQYWDARDGAKHGAGLGWLHADPVGWVSLTSVAGDQFVPVRRAGLGVVLESPRIARESEHVAALLAVALDLALATCELRRTSSEDGDQMEVMQRLALRILNSRDLPEILLQITHEAKRLLEADICGIMLR